MQLRASTYVDTYKNYAHITYAQSMTEENCQKFDKWFVIRPRFSTKILHLENVCYHIAYTWGMHEIVLVVKLVSMPHTSKFLPIKILCQAVYMIDYNIIHTVHATYVTVTASYYVHTFTYVHILYICNIDIHTQVRTYVLRT